MIGKWKVLTTDVDITMSIEGQLITETYEFELWCPEDNQFYLVIAAAGEDDVWDNTEYLIEQYYLCQAFLNDEIGEDDLRIGHDIDPHLIPMYHELLQTAKDENWF